MISLVTPIMRVYVIGALACVLAGGGAWMGVTSVQVRPIGLSAYAGPVVVVSGTGRSVVLPAARGVAR